MNAAKILAIPDDEPERLFGDQAQLVAVYHALVKQWHPDLSSDPLAADVTSKLSKLYAQAKRKSADGTWQEPGVRVLRPRDGKTLKLRYRARSKFELGEVLIGSSHVTYVIPHEHEDLVIAGLRAIGTIRFPTPEFKTALEQFFPKTLKVLELADRGGWSISLAKDPDDVLISDLMDLMGGRIPAEHVAWMVSSMLNLLSYLGEVNKMTVNGLTPSTVFVNPQRHSASFLGGWWYAASTGSGITALPPETYRLAPNKLRIHKKASPELDLACVKHIARVALGDPSGGSLRTRGDVRKEVAEFLLTPAGRSAVVEYKSWYEVLGKRKFVPLRVTGNDVYPLNN